MQRRRQNIMHVHTHAHPGTKQRCHVWECIYIAGLEKEKRLKKKTKKKHKFIVVVRLLWFGSAAQLTHAAGFYLIIFIDKKN